MTAALPRSTARRTSRSRAGLGFLEANPVMYVLPAVLLLLAFAVWPLVVLLRMSFSDVGPANIIGGWHAVGFANFAAALTSADLWSAMLRTLGICAMLLVSNLVLGFLAASVLAVKGRLTNIVLGIMVFVWALPPIVSGSTWKFLLDDSGAVNAVLGIAHLGPVSWLSDPSLALWTVGGVVAWASLPFSTLILRGGLLGVSEDIVEAAAIDGAGYWLTRFRIVLPLVAPTMWILSILTVLYAFKSFDFFYVLTQGGPGTSTYTLPVQAYYAAFTNYKMSQGATIAVISMLVVAVFAVPYVRSIRKEESE